MVPGNDKLLSLTRIESIDAVRILDGLLGESKSEDDWLRVIEKTYSVDIWGVCLLLEYEFVIGYVPVGDWLLERFFENHIPSPIPNLKQKGQILVDSQNV